ncbi:MAG: CinA family protein [Rhodospirillales bacterium]|jgi:nicotinamide-nucleotide amidase|nr:CinA family protein [Rhodospirillales bacterium]
MFPDDVSASARDVLAACAAAGLRVAVAESCTGGLLAACLTAIPGSSLVVERGFVTYTNAAKSELLGVPEALFSSVGAVSEEVARAMAAGALAHSAADVSAAVTGIAGPGGATPDKPVGLVHVAAMRAGGAALHERHVFTGDRDAVRLEAVRAALDLLKHLAD